MPEHAVSGGSNLPELSPLPAADASALQQRARAELRRWLTLDPGALAQRIAALAADEIEVAAALTGRLGAVAADGRAEAVLDELARLVSAVHAPPRPRGPFGFAAPPPPIERRLRNAEPELARLLDVLAQERDRLARAAVAGRSLEARFAEAEAALERAAHLLRLLMAGVEAAGRELSRDDPARAASLATEAAPRAAERARDALTQLAVLRQARLSLALLCDGEEAMVRAIDRTRRTMVSALRTAVAAVNATGAGSRLAERAAALDAAASERTIAAAVGEMRDALAER